MWDRIARTGTFKALNGKDYTFTKANFEKIANNYKSAYEKAPIVLGHPKTDEPAFGWVKELRINGDYLEATYEGVKDDLKKLVDSGAYRYKSVSLYPTLDRIKHIGFLGAVPPAISGLGEVALSADTVSISFAFNDEINKENKSMDEKFAELLQKAQAEITELKIKVATLEEKLQFTEGEKKDAETKLESTESNFAKFRSEIEVATRIAKVDTLIKDGKVMPSEKEDILKLASVFSSPNFATGSETEALFWKRYEAKDDNGLLAQFSKPNEGSAKVVDIVGKL